MNSVSSSAPTLLGSCMDGYELHPDSSGILVDRAGQYCHIKIQLIDILLKKMSSYQCHIFFWTFFSFPDIKSCAWTYSIFSPIWKTSHAFIKMVNVIHSIPWRRDGTLSTHCFLNLEKVNYKSHSIFLPQQILMSVTVIPWYVESLQHAQIL